MSTASKIHKHIAGRDVRPVVFTAEDVRDYAQLAAFGVHLDPRLVRKMDQFAAANDAAPDLQPLINPGSAGIPVQFLQAWLPGFVNVITQAMKIDELIGIDTVGDWEDEEIIQGVLEQTGLAVPYGDLTNIPFASYSPGYDRRTIVRFEQGLRVGTLEELRAAKQRINAGAEKRGAAAISLEIQRNRVGFYGFNGGANRTYGFLNDPNLPAYVAVPAGAGGSTLWANKTVGEISADIRLALAALRTQSGDRIDPKTASITMAISSNQVDFLAITSDFGFSVGDWLRTNYPNVRIVSAPELNGANGGANVFYLYADSFADGSTDGGRVWLQAVPSKFKTLGVERGAKHYIEDYSNATAGVMMKRPFAIVRRTGI